MKKINKIINDNLKEQIYCRYGKNNHKTLEELLNDIEEEYKSGERHKKKHFWIERIVRWLAFFSGVSGSVMALWTFETTEIVLCLPLKMILTLFPIFASFAVTALSCLSDTEKNKETWLRHRIYINNCKNECLAYTAGVGIYTNLDAKEAKHLFLEQMITYRKETDEKFRENMS